MVNIWSALAQGDSDYCAILVIFNSVLQMVLFAPYTIWFINVISDGDTLALQYSDTAIAVAIYLGIPLAAGIVTRFGGIWILGRKRFDTVFMPVFGPLALVSLSFRVSHIESFHWLSNFHFAITQLGLLFVVIVLFALQARNILDNLGPFFRVFVPLILYFVIMWTGTFFLIYYLSCRESRKLRGTSEKGRTWGYKMAVVQSFTSGSNNFELAIAVAIAVYVSTFDWIWKPHRAISMTPKLTSRPFHFSFSGYRIGPSFSSNNWTSDWDSSTFDLDLRFSLAGQEVGLGKEMGWKCCKDFIDASGSESWNWHQRDDEFGEVEVEKGSWLSVYNIYL